jgi:hypothetical protein
VTTAITRILWSRQGEFHLLLLRLTKHVLSASIAAIALHPLSESELRKWRATLPKELAPSTVRRIINDLRAALNGAALKHRSRLPAESSIIIKAGPATVYAETGPARDKTALPDACAATNLTNIPHLMSLSRVAMSRRDIAREGKHYG